MASTICTRNVIGAVSLNKRGLDLRFMTWRVIYTSPYVWAAAGATVVAAAFLLLVPLSDRAASYGMAGDSLASVDSFSGKSGGSGFGDNTIRVRTSVTGRGFHSSTYQLNLSRSLSLRH